MGRRKLLSNSLSLLVNRLTQSITTFVLVAFIARLLGPYELGQYTLAFSYYFLFMTLASQGFKTLFTRELARAPEETPVYLVSGTVLQFIFCLIGYIMLAQVVMVMPYSVSTSIVCYLMGLTIFPFSLSNVTESIFQAQEKMYLITISTVPIYILRIVVMIWAMLQGCHINQILVLMLISETLILLIEWAFILKFVTPEWHIDWSFIKRTAKAAQTFLAIEGISVFRGRMLVLILSIFGGEVVVGLYGAIFQLMQPFDIIANSLVLGVFPSMSKAVNLGKEQQREFAQNLVNILLCVAFPFVIGLLFVGKDLLLLVYRDPSFLQAALPLNLISIGMLFTSFTRPLSYLLVANGHERVNLQEVLIGTIFGSVVSLFLTWKYQLIGATISFLFMQILANSIYMYAVYKLLFSLQWWPIIARPIFLTLFMTVVFVILEQANLNTIVIMIAATLIYIGAVGLLGVYSLGGPKFVFAKLFRK